MKRTFSQNVGQYIWNNLISVDQQLNVLWGGDPQETVSSRLGKIKRKHGGKFRGIARGLDFSPMRLIKYKKIIVRDQ